MNFLRLKPTDALYQQAFGNTDIRGFEVFAEQNESIGKVIDVLVDNAKQSYFLTLDIGSWLSRKRVMLRLPQFQLNEAKRSLYVTGLSREQVKNLPTYDEASIADYPVEFGNRTTSAPILEAPLETSIPLEASPPLETAVRTVATPSREILPTHAAIPDREGVAPGVIAHAAIPDREGVAPGVNLPQTSHAAAQIPAHGIPLAEETVRLLEERLIIDRQKRKVGEVIVRKAVETRMVEVPVRHETLIVEQISPERKQLASIDLNQGSLERLQLREPMSEPMSASNLKSGYSAHEVQSLPIHQAHRVLDRLMQTSQFNNAQVKMVFTDPELQAQYQRWVQEHASR